MSTEINFSPVDGLVDIDAVFRGAVFFFNPISSSLSLVEHALDFVSRHLGNRHVLEPKAFLGALFNKGFHLGFQHARCYWWLYAKSATLDD